MSVTDRYLSIKKSVLAQMADRRRDGEVRPVDGLVHPGDSWHIDFPAQDKENLLIQVLHLKLPMTHEVCEEIGAFQKAYGLDTEATAQLILSLGIVQLRKLMTGPFIEPPPPSQQQLEEARETERAAVRAKLEQMDKERAKLEEQLK